MPATHTDTNDLHAQIETLRMQVADLQQTIDAQKQELEGFRKQQENTCSLSNEDVLAATPCQMQIQEALQESQHNLQTLFDTMQDFLFVIDMQGYLLHHNPVVEKRLGYTTEELHHKHFVDLFPLEQRKEAHVIIEAMLKGYATLCPIPVIAKEGTCIIVETRGARGRWNNQDVLFAVSRDMTEHTYMEEALLDSKARYRVISELISDFAYAARVEPDTNFVLEWITDAFVRTTGFTPEETLHHVLWVPLTHPNDLHILQTHRAHILSGQRSISEFRIVTKSGDIRWLHEHVRPVWDANQNRVVRIYGAAQDITERKRLEENLEQQVIERTKQLEATNVHLCHVNEHLTHARNLLNALFDGLEDGLLLIDNHGIVQIANRAIATLFGTCPEELVGQHWDTLYTYMIERSQLINDICGLSSSSTALRRIRFHTPEGTIRILDLFSIAIHGDNEVTEQVIVHLVDVTENVQLQARVIENERFAASGRLAASVAHEINTPLQSIQTALELIQMTTGEEQAQCLADAQEETQRVGRILNQLLDLYRPTATTYGPVDVTKLLDRIVLLNGKRFREHGIHIELDIPPKLPLLWGRADELMQVLLNVIVNAMEAMPEGGTLGLHASYNAQYQQLAIAIRDTGYGINPDIQERIFEPFVTTRKDGTGQGLSISKQIVQQHGGSLTVQSQLGKGSVFTLVLPTVKRET